MLLYLDSATNRKSHPNENYARELMELFCLGTGAYTEGDIREIARCFTGWEIREGTFRFNRFQHDAGEKSFLGAKGKFDGKEAVRVILDQPAAPAFVAARLIRWLVSDSSAPARLVAPVAEAFRESRLQIAPVVRMILASNLFFSPHARGKKIKSPLDLSIGFLRSLEGTTNIYRLADDVATLGQKLFFPPNVKGWDGGKTWLNAASLVGRINLITRLVAPGESRFAGGSLARIVEKHSLQEPQTLVDWLLLRLVAIPIQAEAKQKLLELAQETRLDLHRRVANVAVAIASLPEFQLN